MNVNTTNHVVSLNSRFFCKQKKLKLWCIRMKAFLKTIKKLAVEKSEDVFTSDKSQEFCLTPLKSDFFLNRIRPAFVRLALGIFNVKIMNKVENYTSIVTYMESVGVYVFRSSKFDQFLYAGGVLVKIFIVFTSCTTLRATPLVVSTLLITYNSKEKVMKSVQVTYFMRGKLLNLFYVLSLELKVIDFIYYIGILIEGRRALRYLVLAKSLRQIDFIILLIIIGIQISFTILDSINLNSSKK